jgi:sugar phosphate permease
VFARTFALTWLAYFGLYLCRRNFSVLMPYLKTELGYSSDQLATVLFTYSVLYCAGQFLMGFLADRWGARLVVTAGMFVSAACSALTGWVTPLAAVQGVNGLAQSAGWPGLLKMTRDWFPAGNRGVMLAWWSTHMVVGGFVATNLAAKVAEGGWMRGAWVPSLVLTGLAVVFVAFARDGSLTKAFPRGERKSGLVLTAPLLAIAAMYFCVKMTRYAFLFWLPLYMTEALQYTPQQAGYASSVYELIGFIGVLAAGYLSDHAGKGKRFGVSAVMMGVLALLCVAYPYLSGSGWMWNVAMIAAIGAVTFGPDTLMAGAAVQDAVPPESTASAAGFVNGVGSSGQILSPYVVSLLSGWFGWHTLFAVLGAASLVGALALATQWKDR